MKQKTILIDTNIWIDYFRNNTDAELLIDLYDEDRLAINDVILAELIPALSVHKKKDAIEKLKSIERLPVFVNWEGIIDLQTQCLKNGMNGIGLPDLMIVQTAIEFKTMIYSKDKHFERMNKFIKFDLYK